MFFNLVNKISFATPHGAEESPHKIKRPYKYLPRDIAKKILI